MLIRGFWGLLHYGNKKYKYLIINQYKFVVHQGELMDTEKEVLSAIQKELSGVTATVGGYNNRLGKIEDAIITLAATQERVNNMADDLKSRDLALQNFQNSMWDELRRLTEHNTQIIETITVLKVRSEDNSKKVDTLEEFKFQASPQIKNNTHFRSWGEKLIFVLITALIMGIFGTIVTFNKPAIVTHEEIVELLRNVPAPPIVQHSQNGKIK